MDFDKKKTRWIGDFVLYENQRYNVYRRNITFKAGEINFHYRMGTEVNAPKQVP